MFCEKGALHEEDQETKKTPVIKRNNNDILPELLENEESIGSLKKKNLLTIPKENTKKTIIIDEVSNTEENPNKKKMSQIDMNQEGMSPTLRKNNRDSLGYENVNPQTSSKEILMKCNQISDKKYPDQSYLRCGQGKLVCSPDITISEVYNSILSKNKRSHPSFSQESLK